MNDMSVTAFSNNPLKSSAQPRPISWKTFERKYLVLEDNWRYEWVNGFVEKTQRSMNQEQFFILFNLRNLFSELINLKKAAGALEAEIDTFFLEKVHRRPDMAWFSPAQLAAMAYGENQVPSFVIEIISTHDKARKLQAKMKDYRAAKVQVIWQIYPDLEEVNVYQNGIITICSGNDLCSAAPALANFELPAKAIFKKPPISSKPKKT